AAADQATGSRHNLPAAQSTQSTAPAHTGPAPVEFLASATLSFNEPGLTIALYEEHPKALSPHPSTEPENSCARADFANNPVAHDQSPCHLRLQFEITLS